MTCGLLGSSGGCRSESIGDDVREYELRVLCVCVHNSGHRVHG